MIKLTVWFRFKMEDSFNMNNRFLSKFRGYIMQKVEIYVKSIKFLSLRVTTIVAGGYHTTEPFYSIIPLLILKEFRFSCME